MHGESKGIVEGEVLDSANHAGEGQQWEIA
jgi:hypothetical protein